MTKILLVEDDPAVSELLTLSLEGEGYAVRAAHDGTQALAGWELWAPDLIVLDLMLPGIDGIEVCRRVRARDEQVPIVMLTARTDAIDVVTGLESGADDYVTKPFDTQVLLSRIGAVMRRTRRDPLAAGVLRLGDVEVDVGARRVTRAGEPVSLTPTEFKLLEQLVRHAGQVLSREDLLRLVWGYDYLGDSRLVDVGIGRLRAKIETDPSDPTLVLTRRGFGYYAPGAA